MSKELIILLHYFYNEMSKNIDTNILIMNTDVRLSIISTNLKFMPSIGDVIAYKILRNND